MNDIRFVTNGLKVNGEYVPCNYHINSGYITIYAREYGSQLPHELGNVQNDSDGQTDYFEKDHVNVTRFSPFYKECYKAAAKKAVKLLNQRIRHCEKMIAKYPQYKGSYELEIAECKKSIASFEA